MSALARPRLQTSSLASAAPLGAPDSLDNADRAVAAAVRPLRARIEALEAELAALRALVVPEPVAAGRDPLREACADLAIPISGDGHVLERHAARLLNRSPSTLRGWRRTDGRLACRTFAGKTEYSLDTLAEFIASVGSDH